MWSEGVLDSRTFACLYAYRHASHTACIIASVWILLVFVIALTRSSSASSYVSSPCVPGQQALHLILVKRTAGLEAAGSWRVLG